MEAEQLREQRAFVEKITGECESAYQALLPLDEPRVIAIQDGKFTYTFHFARISHADWMGYFDSIYFTSRNQDASRVDTLDLNTCGVELFESKLLKAEGYAGDFMRREKWQQKIPPRHSLQVAWLLRLVSPSTSERDSPFDPERMEVRIDALWSQTKPGQVTLYKGLVHWFASPSAQQKRRFYRAGAESKIIGGSRNGTTIHASRHRVLLDLYDELIIDVEGYSIAGRELHDPQEIKREMDAYHKVEAATHLLTGSSAPAQAQEAEAA